MLKQSLTEHLRLGNGKGRDGGDDGLPTGPFRGHSQGTLVRGCVVLLPGAPGSKLSPTLRCSGTCCTGGGGWGRRRDRKLWLPRGFEGAAL